MSKRKKRMLLMVPPGRAPAGPGSPSPEPPVPAQAAAAGVVGLQKSMGNAAVAQLMRKLNTPERPAIDRPDTRAGDFAWGMRVGFGVKKVTVGTEADQVREMRASTPDAEASPESIPGWQAWAPWAGSAFYDDIVAAFTKMAQVLGGTPPVDEVRFLESAYENVGGTATQRRDHGANYGGGVMSVFQISQSMTWAMADGASTDARPATVTPQDSSTSRRWIIIHELCHGIAEMFGTPGKPGFDQGFFAAFNEAAGWAGGKLMQTGTELTRHNWNQPWPDQPVSRYALRNPGEDFAESLLAYIVRPDMLRARSPRRFAFFDSRRAGWTQHLHKRGSPL